MLNYYLIFIFSAVLASFSNTVTKKSIVFLLIVILSLFAGTRLNIDEDFKMYYKVFYYIEDTTKKFSEKEIPIEWCVYFITHFFKYIFISKVDYTRATILAFAFLGVTTKLIAIKKYSYFFILSVLLYVSNLFLMMEMTTIRAGVAAGIFMLSLNDLEEKNIKKFSIKLLLCLFFHSSSVVFIIPFLLIYFNTKIKYFYIAIVISFISALAKINILKLFFLDRIFPRVEVYFKMMEWQKNEGTNIFSFRSLFALGIIILCSIYYKKLKLIKYFEVLFKIHIISICLFFLLSTTAEAFSIRTFELLSVVQIILYPMIIFIFNKKLRFFGWILIIAYSLLQIIYLLEVADIYKPYKSWFF